MERVFYLGDPDRFLSDSLDRKDRVSLISSFTPDMFLRKRKQHPFDYLILDGRAGAEILAKWLSQLECCRSLPPLILAVDRKTPLPDEWENHFLLTGVYDGAPLLAELFAGCRRILSRVRDSDNKEPSPSPSRLGILGDSPSIRELRENIGKFARHRDYSVLIMGESGTGKGLVARALHHLGHGEDAPFVTYQSTIPGNSFMAADLFGVRKGAYTGSENRPGLLAKAAGGVFFLDEVGTLSQENQVSLLGVLDGGKYRPMGAVAEETSRFRFLSATNEDLPRAVEEGLFRRDLYHRINTLIIRISPLRERKEDIPLLVDHFLAEERAGKGYTPTALMKLAKHEWPGNVRELRNVVRRSLVECGKGEQIEARHVIMD